MQGGGLRHLPLSLVEQTESPLEPCCIGILLGPNLCLPIFDWSGQSGMVHRLDLRPRFLHGPGLPVLLHTPDLCPHILDQCLRMAGPDLFGAMMGIDLSGCLRRPDLGPGIFPVLCVGIFYGLWGLHGLDELNLGPCIFLSRPYLKFLERTFGHPLGLRLAGSFNGAINFIARWRVIRSWN